MRVINKKEPAEQQQKKTKTKQRLNQIQRQTKMMNDANVLRQEWLSLSFFHSNSSTLPEKLLTNQLKSHVSSSSSTLYPHKITCKFHLVVGRIIK